MKVLLLITGLTLVLPAFSNQQCNVNLDNWLECNNRIVLEYLENISEREYGSVLDGVQLTDGKTMLDKSVFLGKTTTLQQGTHIYLFQSGGRKEAFMWVEKKGKDFPLPVCEPVGLPNGPLVLSGDRHTWKNAKPGGDIVWLTCPPEEWFSSQEK